jgi:cytochrome c553
MRAIAVLFLYFILGVASTYADGIGNEAQPVYEMCAACHGLDGLSHMPKFPKLAGQSAAYIIKQLEDFLHGRRANDQGQMETAASVLTATQRLEVARYFSELPPPPASTVPSGAAVRGKELYEKPDIFVGVPACGACHALSAPGSETAGGAIPRLMGQHRDYTAKQLRNFKSGDRMNDPGGVMQSLAKALSDEDIEAIAAFLEAAPSNR